ncbi:autotransporter outer membrane beta-barrel domain-containing protein [Stenotrophomonas rhizophila]|uniref:autotransporter family protein n=1 Tax=Stenotrophomonas rhizophila TaxID=216778 RepID=UPI001E2AA6C5|nr:autotransporter outer membrane beta-barrel domain-containing protein [Stenotrophomonas rhizophila]MCC7634563.1 autotransporter outer membrane beta-barrel domain-containing protein [Stenotrophomonas rhizophila]MCC7664168.1 autotransporter outer membrane beta-barrel domain-containing protein [Stenotrophomonas rhizophila]
MIQVAVSRPGMLSLAVHAALLASSCMPAFAAQVVADGVQVHVAGGDYDDAGGNGADSSAFYARRGGSIVAGGAVNLTANGFGVNAALADGAGSTITLLGGRLDSNGNFGNGLFANAGGRIEGDALDIRKSGIGHGVFVEGLGSHVRLSNSQISTQANSSHGLVVFIGASAELSGSRIHTLGDGSMGININRGNPRVALADVEVLTEGAGATGLWLLSAGQVDAQGLNVRTLGAGSAAVDMRAGRMQLDSARLETHGRNAHGVLVRMEDTAGAVFMGNNVDIGTQGDAAMGMVVQAGADVVLQGSRVHTSGNRSHAVSLGGAGSALDLVDSAVLAQGAQAWGLLASGGSFNMVGGELGSAQHGAIGVTGTAQLDFSQGTRIRGGNGVLLSLESTAGDQVAFNLRDGVQAEGNIIAADPGVTPHDSNLQVLLDNRVHWTGATGIVDSLQIKQGSRWTITGDSTVNSLSLGDAVIAFAAPDAGDFSTLTVQGNYHSDGGTLLLNARLDGSGVATDRLLVNGDTSGHTWLLVNNLGGSGLTAADGIEVIDVQGQSNGQFALGARAVHGAYEYFLFQGGVDDPNNGNWYLRSQLPDEVKDPQPDPDPVLRPEPGAYWANQAAATAMFQHALQDRLGGRLPHPAEYRRGAWARTSQQQVHHNLQAGQLALRSQRSLLQAGTDLFGNDSTRFGVMLGHGQASSQSQSVATGYLAQGRVNGAAVGVYATWFEPSEDQRGLQVDSWLQWARYRQNVQGAGLAAERYTAHGTSGSLELNYALPVQLGDFTTLYIEPQLQLMYTAYKAADHVERNGTVVAVHGAGGLSTRTGVRLYGRRGTPGGHVQQHAWVQPYLTVNWLRNSQATDALNIGGTPWVDNAGAERVEIKAGAQWQMTPRLNGWGEFGVQSGQGGFHAVAGQLGLRYSW